MKAYITISTFKLLINTVEKRIYRQNKRSFYRTHIQ